MELRDGTLLLNSRYRLTGLPYPVEGQPSAQLWVARDTVDDIDCLVKLWPAKTLSVRALWDAELRALYRLASSPHAEDVLVRLTYAEMDRSAERFVMILSTPSVTPLEDLFGPTKRTTVAWLDVKSPANRRELWNGLQTVADGIRLLHRQHVLHRSIGASNVYCDPADGPPSMRLGGFEWSVRLGLPAGSAPPNSWAVPPEFFRKVSPRRGYGPDTDWYAFGMFATRLLVPAVEAFAAFEPLYRHDRVYQAVTDTSQAHLSAPEREFLLSLIDHDSRSRRTFADSVSSGIKEVIAGLIEGRDIRSDERRLVLVFTPAMADSEKIFKHYVKTHVLPNSTRKEWDPRDWQLVDQVIRAVQDDMAEAMIYSWRGPEAALLIGKSGLCLRIGQYRFQDEPEASWRYARINGVTKLNQGANRPRPITLPLGKVYCCSWTVLTSDKHVQKNSRDWLAYLPTVDRTLELTESLQTFHDFLRCTNQFELLLRYGEIFPYVLSSQGASEGGVPTLRVREGRRAQELPKWCAPPTLVHWLTDHPDDQSLEANVFYIYGEREDPFDNPKGRVEWRFVNVDSETGDVILQPVLLARRSDDEYGPAASSRDEIDANLDTGFRPFDGEEQRVSPVGFLRPKNLGGQLTLLMRRQKAIAQLREHSFLLQALARPERVWMDTGPAPDRDLPRAALALSADKQAVIRDVLRVRPIYALQGPPGTGKTTLVAHLVRAIIEEDAVAQILITAPTHEAVDILMAKISNEAFADQTNPRKRPLAIRLRKRQADRGDAAEDSGSVQATARGEIDAALEALSQPGITLSPLQLEWRERLAKLKMAFPSWRTSQDLTNFEDLVALGANLTYCTVSSGDLEELAKSTQSFDWAIVEEAGKSHGFDLALPLHAGHRWLLIGDQFQLPPYFFEKYRDGLNDLDRVVAMLSDLPRGARWLKDEDWLRAWQDTDPDAKREFVAYAVDRLRTFEAIFNRCVDVRGCLTAPEEDCGAAAGQLSVQHRMHPVLGDLVSRTFYAPYDRELTSAKQHDDPSVTHPLHLPDGTKLPAIVWLDVPLPAGSKFWKHNPEEILAIDAFMSQVAILGDTGAELEVALLSPYRAQVKAMKDHFASRPCPKWARPRRAARDAFVGRTRGPDGVSHLVAHTIDGFQGNQARIVVASLTRNLPETAEGGKAIEFLNRFRTNVLISRAEALLVLVGGWEFFRRQVLTIAPDDKNREMWHWRKLIDQLDEAFRSGDALRVRVDNGQLKADGTQQ